MTSVTIFCLIIILIGVIFSVFLFNVHVFTSHERFKMAFMVIMATGAFLIVVIYHNEFIRIIALLTIIGLTCYSTVYVQKKLKEDDRHPDKKDFKLCQAISILMISDRHIIVLTDSQRQWLNEYVEDFSEGRQEHAYNVVSDIIRKASPAKLKRWSTEFSFRPFQKWLKKED